MNNDYKSALSKIHLDDMKKEQMKQLFKKKHMNKKNKNSNLYLFFCISLV